MTKPLPKPELPDEHTHAQSRREQIRRRLAERGVIVQIPAEGEWLPPEHPLPVSADELSEAVILMRRGDY